jgi:hypothetical protein
LLGKFLFALGVIGKRHREGGPDGRFGSISDFMTIFRRNIGLRLELEGLGGSGGSNDPD